MNKEELLKVFGKINWDTPCSAEDIYRVYSGEISAISGIDKTWIYHKVLNGFRWYEVIRIFPKNELPAVLSEDVIQRLFPRQLRDKYRHVRTVLFG